MGELTVEPDGMGMVTDYLLNNGTCGELAVGSVPEAEVAAVWDEVSIRSGRCEPPFDGFQITLSHQAGGAMFSVYYRKVPVLTCGLVRREEAAGPIWWRLQRRCQYLQKRFPTLMEPGIKLHRPNHPLWLAVLVMPPWHTKVQESLVQRAFRFKEAVAGALWRYHAT